MKNKTYAGIPAEYSKFKTSEIVLIPVPYDGTSTWVKGADKGPSAFLEASENMELYDIETNSEVYKKGVFLASEININSSPEDMSIAVYNEVKNYLKEKKFVTLIGGEHSISIGSIRAFKTVYPNLSVLQIDAHADLRETYNGSTHNHACAMFEANKTTNLVQVGIRSMDVTEKSVMNLENTFFAHHIIKDKLWIDNAISKLGDTVYITLDLDALDPSIMPSTGTPEPGGLLWYDVLEFLKQVFKTKNVVGLDIVELCPNKNNKAPDFLAAKLYYKLLSYKFFKDRI